VAVIQGINHLLDIWDRRGGDLAIASDERLSKRAKSRKKRLPVQDYRQEFGEKPFSAFIILHERDERFAQQLAELLADVAETAYPTCNFFFVEPMMGYSLRETIRRNAERYHVLSNGDDCPWYDDREINSFVRYFSIPTEHVPCLLVIKNIKYSDILYVDLRMSIEERVSSQFLGNLSLLFSRDNIRDWTCFHLRSLIDSVPFSQEPSIQDKLIVLLSRGTRNYSRGLDSNNITYHINLPQSVEETFRKIATNTQHLDIPEGKFKDTLRKTDTVIAERRSRLTDELLQLFEAEDFSPEQIAEQHQRIRKVFDDALLEQSQRLVNDFFRREWPEQVLPVSIAEYTDLLEPASRQVLNTAESLWNNLRDVQIPTSFDFSVCAIGLWKALEIEVNRTFVDALRVKYQLCSPGAPSIHQTHPNQILVSMSVKGTERKVDISELRDNQLANIELGKVSGLVKGADKNDLKALIDSLKAPQVPLLVHKDLGTAIKKVATKYRNPHAHMRPMERDICNDFRGFILNNSDQTNPLLATLMYKREFQKQGLI
jgi:hypothetical protein